MATKSMSYDNPAYVAVLPLPTGNISGSAGVGNKYSAFTGMIVKSVTVRPMTAGTSNDVVSFISLIGTTTTTTALTTFGSGSTTGVNVALSSANTFSQLDNFWVVKGTDATLVVGGMIEAVISPNATVTA